MNRYLRTLTMGILVLAAMILPSLAYAESIKMIEANGRVLLFNDTEVSGLWAAYANFEQKSGSLLAIIKSNGIIYIVTVMGENPDFSNGTLNLSGHGLIAKNGEILNEGDSTVTITNNHMDININGSKVRGDTTYLHYK